MCATCAVCAVLCCAVPRAGVQILNAAIVVRAHNIVEDSYAWVITAIVIAVYSLMFAHNLVAFDTIAKGIPSENANIPGWTVVDTFLTILRVSF